MALKWLHLSKFTDDEEECEGHGYNPNHSQFVVDVLIRNLVDNKLETFAEMVIDWSETFSKVQEDNNDIDEVEKELHSEAKVEIILLQFEETWENWMF